MMTYPGLISCLMAFVFVVAVLPLVRRAALRLNLFDQPGPLKIHTQPIARLGGVAMTLGLLAAILFGPGRVYDTSFPFLASVLWIWLVGLWDDAWGLSPGLRLAAQFGAAIFLVKSGWSGTFVGDGIVFPAAACVFLVVFINAFNFLDGSDGLAGGVAAVIALGYVLLNGGSASSLGGRVAWALLGSCTGFLLSNFPPAKIFMGDCGSTTLGFVVGFLGLNYYSGGDLNLPRLLVPLLFGALPLLDFALAVLRRLKSGSSPFTGDRRHLYDLLLQRGWSRRRVALCFYFATALLLVPGLLFSRAGPRWQDLMAHIRN